MQGQTLQELSAAFGGKNANLARPDAIRSAQVRRATAGGSCPDPAGRLLSSGSDGGDLPAQRNQAFRMIRHGLAWRVCKFRSALTINPVA